MLRSEWACVRIRVTQSPFSHAEKCPTNIHPNQAAYKGVKSGNRTCFLYSCKSLLRQTKFVSNRPLHICAQLLLINQGALMQIMLVGLLSCLQRQSICRHVQHACNRLQEKRSSSWWPCPCLALHDYKFGVTLPHKPIEIIWALILWPFVVSAGVTS